MRDQYKVFEDILGYATSVMHVPTKSSIYNDPRICIMGILSMNDVQSLHVPAAARVTLTLRVLCVWALI